MMLGWTIAAVSVVVVFTIIALIFYKIYSKVFKPGKNAKRILEEGLPGKAKVLALAETGMRINDNPQVRMTLEVTPDRGHRPYTAETTVILSILQIPQFQPGARLLVKIDPQDPKQVAVAGMDSSPA